MTLLFDSERSGHTLVPFVGGRQCDPLQRCVKNCPQGHTLRHTLRLSHTAEKCLHHAVSPNSSPSTQLPHTRNPGSKEGEETLPDKTTTLSQHRLVHAGTAPGVLPVSMATPFTATSKAVIS